MVPKQATTALDVHLALEIGSRVLDRHRVPSAAAPTLSLQGPFKGADPPPPPPPPGGRVVAGSYQRERGVCAEQ